VSLSSSSGWYLTADNAYFITLHATNQAGETDLTFSCQGSYDEASYPDYSYDNSRQSAKGQNYCTDLCQN
jgi:hypothetical protein